MTSSCRIVIAVVCSSLVACSVGGVTASSAHDPSAPSGAGVIASEGNTPAPTADPARTDRTTPAHAAHATSTHVMRR
jgi:hypothetical protein